MPALKLDLFRGLEGLPSPPFQLLKVLDEVGEASTRDFNVCRVIQNDPSMACRILKTANTRLYGYPSKILSLQQAAGLLGPGPIKSIVLTTPMLERFTGNAAPQTEMNGIGPWRHMAVTAMIAGCLGKLLPHMEPDVCYTAGLIHDIGKIALAAHHPGLLAEIVRRVKQTGVPFRQAEREIIGVSHADIAAELAAAWAFPELLTDALKTFSHWPAARSGNNLAGALYLADYLANDWGFDDGVEHNAAPLPREILPRLGVSAGDLEQWMPELRETAQYAAED